MTINLRLKSSNTSFSVCKILKLNRKKFSVSSRIREFKCFVAKLSIWLSIYIIFNYSISKWSWLTNNLFLILLIHWIIDMIFSSLNMKKSTIFIVRFVTLSKVKLTSKVSLTSINKFSTMSFCSSRICFSNLAIFSSFFSQLIFIIFV